MKIICVILILIMFGGCREEIPSGSDIAAGGENTYDNYNLLTESVWLIRKITFKSGTDNPDEIVPPAQQNEITNGSVIAGEIILNPDSTVSINNAADNFYFGDLDGARWDYNNGFIRFMYSYGGAGYHTIIEPGYMKWYIAGTGIESGIRRVTIIEFVAK
jgi:hypothetical protein